MSIASKLRERLSNVHKNLSIPVFRGSRLRVNQEIEEYTRPKIRVFQSPFSGDLNCEQIKAEFWDSLEQVFKSPFSGDLDCEFVSKRW